MLGVHCVALPTALYLKRILALRSFTGLSSANDRAGAAFTVGPVQEMAIAYA